jgi:hypothetical protein
MNQAEEASTVQDLPPVFSMSRAKKMSLLFWGLEFFGERRHTLDRGLFFL